VLREDGDVDLGYVVLGGVVEDLLEKPLTEPRAVRVHLERADLEALRRGERCWQRTAPREGVLGRTLAWRAWRGKIRTLMMLAIR
jgi:hypothetical protein